MFKQKKSEFLKTDEGQKILKQIAILSVENERLKQRNDDLEAMVLRLSAKCHDLNEEIKENDILTKDEEDTARNLMNEISIYKGEKPSRYLYSIVDDNDHEVRIYTSQVKDIIKNLSKTIKETEEGCY